MNYEAVPSGEQLLAGFQRQKQVTNNVIGWYLYSFSSEPFIVSAVSTYVPLMLEQFARINGVRLDDHSLSCSEYDGKCVLGLFNDTFYIDTSSFALYTFSLSVFCQTIMVISISGLADIWKSVQFKGKVVVAFGIGGALSTVAISQLNSSQFYSLAFLSIASNCCYGVVNVVGNSLLPLFVADLLKYCPEHRNSDIEKLTTLISGRGSSLGYISALLVQICSIFLVRMSKSHDNIQVAVFFVGIWWFIWQLPMTWLLKDVVLVEMRPQQLNLRHATRYLKYGWMSLFESLKHARLLKDVMVFLVGWFIISDSITTINSTAILFAKTELKMNTLNMISVSILTLLSAICGAIFIPELLSVRLKQPPQRAMIYIICWASVIPLYGTLGFFFDTVGLKHKFEMYLLAIWYGVALGGLSAVSRSVFSLIIPIGKESTFFSLFNVTDKGSSIMGPFLIGVLTDKTHNIRYSFYLLLMLLILSLPVFNALNVERGRREAKELSELNQPDDQNE